jgi:hypothetical protein
MVAGNPIPPEPSQEPRPPRRKRYPGKCPNRFDQRYKELHPEAFPGIHARVFVSSTFSAARDSPEKA